MVRGGAIVGEASGEGGLLIEGSESDGYEGLGQVPLRILPSSNSQSPQGHKLVIRDEGVVMQNEDGEKEEDWGGGSKCVLGGKLFGKVPQISGFLNCGIRKANFAIS